MVERQKRQNQCTLRDAMEAGPVMWDLGGYCKAFGRTVEREVKATKTRPENAKKDKVNTETTVAQTTPKWWY